MIEIKVKGLSVNECWQGKRFKTPAYKSYELACLFILPKITVPEGKLKIIIEVGVSNSGADIDNFLKPFLDILQKKYGLNDNQIWDLNIRKFKVEKGNEVIRFELENLKD